MKAIATVNPKANAWVRENEKDNFLMPRTWDRFQNKIRLYVNCSIKIIT
jgi:hypothetical protein